MVLFAKRRARGTTDFENNIKAANPQTGKPEPVRTLEFCLQSCRQGFDKWTENYQLDCMVVNGVHALPGNKIVCTPITCIMPAHPGGWTWIFLDPPEDTAIYPAHDFEINQFLATVEIICNRGYMFKYPAGKVQCHQRIDAADNNAVKFAYMFQPDATPNQFFALVVEASFVDPMAGNIPQCHKIRCPEIDMTVALPYTWSGPGSHIGERRWFGIEITQYVPSVYIIGDRVKVVADPPERLLGQDYEDLYATTKTAQENAVVPANGTALPPLIRSGIIKVVGFVEEFQDVFKVQMDLNGAMYWLPKIELELADGSTPSTAFLEMEQNSMVDTKLTDHTVRDLTIGPRTGLLPILILHDDN